MKSAKELMQSNRRFVVLGGRSLAENAAYWAERNNSNVIALPTYEKLPERYDFREHLGRCAVPSRLVDVIASGAEETPVVQATRKWLDSDASFLLLHGETGGGKSLAAALVFERARDTVRWVGGEMQRWNSGDCYFIAASELSRGSYFDDDSRRLIRHLKRVRFLVLDELGAELASAPYLSTLDEVMTERFGDARRRTVLTSNVSARRPANDKPSPFEERYGSRIARRIRESGTVVAVERRP